MKIINAEYISSHLSERSRDSHKGDYGHALLIAGSYGMGGSAILASGAALRSGVGLLTTHVPAKLYDSMQISVPEAMCSVDLSDEHFSSVPNPDIFSAVGIGPGLGMAYETVNALKDLLKLKPGRLVADADALNIIGHRPEFLELLPPNTIITPHPAEFERIAGKCSNREERIKRQVSIATQYGIIVVLKGSGTTVAMPDGELWENTTGNPGMATAGSGDVLTGVILGLLAQKYSPQEAALMGVFVHGLAGDIAKDRFGEVSMTAGDIRDSLSFAFLKLR